MTPTMLTQHISLILIILLCIVCAIESRNRGTSDISEKKRTKSKLLSHTIPHLCSKEYDMKLACHCNNKDIVTFVDCIVLHDELSQSDVSWQAFKAHQHTIQELLLTVTHKGYMGYLPTEVIKYQINLQKINIQYADIHQIPPFAFSNLTNLINITLTQNQIVVLDNYAFANHPRLIDLILEDNQIERIDRYAFWNVPELLDLNLCRNNISILHEEIFSQLGKLNKLKLYENSISVLTGETFKGLGNLRALDLSYNNLTFIGDTVFAELWSLQELDLSNNAIVRLSERAFDGLNILQTLNLKHNKLTILESGIFRGANALTTLNLNGNLLETLTYNNVQPIMDNLVNNTSVLSISENKFVCDCRLLWIYDLKNRTKNFDLKRTLEKLRCSIDKIHHDRIVNHHGKTNRIHEIHTYSLNPSPDFDNQLPNGGNYNRPRHSEHSIFDHIRPSSVNQQNTVEVELFNWTVDELPCAEELADATELPLSRESIGMDFGWLSGKSVPIHNFNFVNLCFMFTIWYMTFS